jgi:hypothetical protein
MKANTKFHFVPVGLPRNGVQPPLAKLCEFGHAKIQKYDAKLQYKKAEGIKKDHHPLNFDPLRIKGTPYVRARYRDPETGKERRMELGRWLLDSELPVAHINGDLQDFCLENLVAQETAKQKAIHERAALRRAASQERSARWAEKRAADHARRPKKGPDGLTPEQQEAELCSPEYQKLLRKLAYSRLRDATHLAVEMAAEIVAEVTTGCLKPVRERQVEDVRAYSYFSVRTQADKARKKARAHKIEAFGTQISDTI